MNQRLIEAGPSGVALVGLSGTEACVLDREIKREQLKNGEGDEEKK